MNYKYWFSIIALACVGVIEDYWWTHGSQGRVIAHITMLLVFLASKCLSEESNRVKDRDRLYNLLESLAEIRATASVTVLSDDLDASF